MWLAIVAFNVLIDYVTVLSIHVVFFPIMQYNSFIVYLGFEKYVQD